MGQIKLDPHPQPTLPPFFPASPVQKEERESALRGLPARSGELLRKTGNWQERQMIGLTQPRAFKHFATKVDHP